MIVIYITKELESDRLILRKVNKEDYKQAYNNWCSDSEVTKYVMWNVHKNEEETKKLFNIWEEEYSKPYTFRWGVELKSTNELIGVIDVVKFKKKIVGQKLVIVMDLNFGEMDMQQRL